MSTKDKIQERIDKIGESHKIADKAKSMSNWLVNWASNNRKKMFVITVFFLVFVFMTTIVFTISSVHKSKVAKEEMLIMRDSLKTQRKNQMGNSIPDQLLDYQTLKNYEAEINELIEKDSLTSEDSLRIMELYDILIFNELNKN